MTHTLINMGDMFLFSGRVVVVFGHVEECSHEAGGRVGLVMYSG